MTEVATANGTQVTSSERIARVREVMRDANIDLLIATPGSDLGYLIGYAGHASERPTVLAISEDSAFIVLPRLEAPRLADLPGAEKRIYGETDDPYQLIKQALEVEPARVAISDQAWSAVLLGLQAIVPSSSFVPASGLLRQLRMMKSARELELLQKAGAMADRAFENFVRLKFSGQSELQLGHQLSDLVQQEGLDASQWPPIVASGPNAASPHHLTSDRQVQEGDAVILDFGGNVEGYSADISRTVHVGSPDEELLRIHEVVKQAQQAGVDAVGVGVQAQAVDRAARGVIHAAGYGDFFVHRTGHGIGLDIHEEPYIVEGNSLPLQPGMTFSVEPGIYLPARMGVRIEDIVAVGDEGAQRLNNASRDLMAVR